MGVNSNIHNSFNCVNISTTSRDTASSIGNCFFKKEDEYILSTKEINEGRFKMV
jgi:hypothetical protein